MQLTLTSSKSSWQETQLFEAKDCPCCPTWTLLSLYILCNSPLDTEIYSNLFIQISWLKFIIHEIYRAECEHGLKGLRRFGNSLICCLQPIFHFLYKFNFFLGQTTRNYKVYSISIFSQKWPFRRNAAFCHAKTRIDVALGWPFSASYRATFFIPLFCNRPSPALLLQLLHFLHSGGGDL